MVVKRQTARRFRAAGFGLVAVSLVILGVARCVTLPERAPPPAPPPVQAPAPSPSPPPQSPPPAASADCNAPAFAAAAQANAASLGQMSLNLFGRPETGWEVYAPVVAREIGTACAPDTPGFAQALAAWTPGGAADGVVAEPALFAVKAAAQGRRPIVGVRGRNICPDPPTVLADARAEEGYGGKAVQLRPGALAAYRAMAQAARAESPEIAADPRFLQIFSAFRSPEYDAARCARDQNCNGVTRATCSPHRTGLAMDIYVGQAPGFGPDSSADPNRLAQSRTAAYRWLVLNAGRFGFVGYAFEPWHWEWTGEAP